MPEFKVRIIDTNLIPLGILFSDSDTLFVTFLFIFLTVNKLVKVGSDQT